MEYALDKALQEMTLDDDKPIVLEDLPQFSSCVRNKCSIIGRLLCPENQKLSSLIHEMPRLWRVYNRARGIALPNDQFQFIFDSETELSIVLDTGAWTFNDWSVTLERWVEQPPNDYLKILPIWIRLRHIPVNYNTAETIKAIASHFGQVTHVAFDLLKPQSKGYVRVRILFDVSRPLKYSRDLQLPSGDIVVIGVEYERIRRRCYQCQRLTHDKEHCPFNPLNRQSAATGGSASLPRVPSRLIPRISKHDPLFGVLTDDDVGFDLVSGKPKIAKPVLDEMRQYLSVADPQLRKVHVEHVRQSVWNLDGDKDGQKQLLQLEAPPEVTTDMNKGKGIVFEFEGIATVSNPKKCSSEPVAGTRRATERISQPELSTLVSVSSSHRVGGGSTVYGPSFSAGYTGAKTKRIKKRRRPNQWVRKVQAALSLEVVETNQVVQHQETLEASSSKRKAISGSDVSSKVARRNEKVVPDEGPPMKV